MRYSKSSHRSLLRDDPGRVVNRKALQLCKQVEQTLSLVLAGETGDPVLLDVWVQSVVPAPNAGRLLVALQLAPSAAHDSATVLQHVVQAYGFLRAEVAHAIHRRKVPELLFRVTGNEPH